MKLVGGHDRSLLGFAGRSDSERNTDNRGYRPSACMIVASPFHRCSMRAIALLGGAALLSACAASPPATNSAADRISSADSSSIVAVSTRLAAAGRATNWDAWSAEYVAEPTRLAPNLPPLVGKTAIDEFNKAAPKFTSFDAVVTWIDGRGDMAVTTGNYNFTAPAGKDAAGKATPAINEDGKFMQVLMKQPDGSWKITRDIWNSNLPVTPMPSPRK